MLFNSLQFTHVWCHASFPSINWTRGSEWLSPYVEDEPKNMQVACTGYKKRIQQKRTKKKRVWKKEKGRPQLIIRVGNTYIRFRGVIVESKNRLSRISVMLLSDVKTGRTATSLLLCAHCVFRSKCIPFCLHFNLFSDGWGIVRLFLFLLRSRCCSQWMQIVFVSCTHIRTIIEAWWNNDPRSAD